MTSRAGQRRCRGADPQISFRVTDSGIGMTREQMDRKQTDESKQKST